jgi:hypothetical protein
MIHLRLNFHKYSWTSLDEKTHDYIDHVLIDGRWHSSLRDLRSSKGAECDTDHYLVLAKVRKHPSVSQQEAQNFDVDKFNLKKLNELAFGKQYQSKILNISTALNKLNSSKNIKRVWKILKRLSSSQVKED